MESSWKDITIEVGLEEFRTKKNFSSALIGGWAGGIAAMNMFKHKTIKQEFRV